MMERPGKLSMAQLRHRDEVFKEEDEREATEEQVSQLRITKSTERLSLDDKLDIGNRRSVYIAFLQGNMYYDGKPMSLDEMAKMEAESRVEATQRRLRTIVDPGQGWQVTWKNRASDIAKKYEKRVQKYMSEEGTK